MVPDYKNLKSRFFNLQGEVDSIYSRIADINQEISNLVDKIEKLWGAIVSENAVSFGEMRFATQEDAENCTQAVGEGRIKKYYFGIKD